MKNAPVLLGLCLTLLVTGCTFATPRYSISADNNEAVKSLKLSNIAIGTFAGPSTFDSSCRLTGSLAPLDKVTYTDYIRKAFEAEFKLAGALAVVQPRVTLSGNVTSLEFSSSRNIIGGSWLIDLALNSSNGKQMTISEVYEFESGYNGETACRQTAEAFVPAVQDLIGKTVRSSQFKVLVQ